MPLQIRRGTEVQRGNMTVPLAEGELLYVTDDAKLYVGDGATLGGIQITGYTDADARDAAAGIFSGVVHSGINFSYNTSTDKLTATVNLSDYTGTINASAVKGTLVADDSTILIDGIEGKINLDGTVKGNIVPNANETYDLGSATYRFRDLYLSGSSIRLGNAVITSTGTAVDLPAGSTIGGTFITVTNGSNYNINIVGDDSTFIVNSSTKQITGTFNGPLTGNVNGTVTGNIFTTLIDSADSSAINFTPAVVFNSDITANNEIFAKKINTVGTVNVLGSITVGDGTEDIIMQGRADGPIIKSLSEELVLESNASIGPQVRVNLKSSATTAGSLLTGLSSVQLFDLKSFKNGATATNPGNIASGDILSAISFTGRMQSSLSDVSCAFGVQADPNGTLTATHIPSKFFFLAQPDTFGGGFKFMTFDSRGRLAINQETASATLDVNGFAKLAVLTSAPAGATNGMVAIADGVGWDPAGTGKSVMVVYLGGGWRVAATAP